MEGRGSSLDVKGRAGAKYNHAYALVTKESEIRHEWSILSVFKPSLEERTLSISMYHRHQASKLVLDCGR